MSLSVNLKLFHRSEAANDMSTSTLGEAHRQKPNGGGGGYGKTSWAPS
jgi:hypothetical protein